MSSSEDDDLTTRLGHEMHRRAGPISDTPVGLDRVKRTARTIRRRRATVGGIAAAAAAAVLLPAALLGPELLPDDSPRDRDEQTVAQAPEGPVVLDANASEGMPAKVPRLDGRELAVGGETKTELPADYSAFAPAGDDYLAVRQADGAEAHTYVDVLDSQGDVLDSRVMTGRIASSRDGSVAAWAEPSGEVLTRSGGRTVPMTTVPRPVQVTDVLGSGRCGPEESGCAVYFNEVNPQHPPGVARADGSFDTLPGGLRSVETASEDGLVAGLVTDPDTTGVDSCSAVFDEESGEQQFQTCEHVFGETRAGFSPDGGLVVAERPEAGGSLPRSLALLDSGTGDVELEIRAGPESDRASVGVVRALWEDEDHLLVKTQAPGRHDAGYVYTVYRAGLDGSVERLYKSEPSGGGIMPLLLPE